MKIIILIVIIIENVFFIQLRKNLYKQCQINEKQKEDDTKEMLVHRYIKEKDRLRSPVTMVFALFFNNNMLRGDDVRSSLFIIFLPSFSHV